MFNFKHITPNIKFINKIKSEIYETSSNGFFIVKDFISKDSVYKLRDFWSSTKNLEYFKKIDKVENIFYSNCPNYNRIDKKGNKMFYNFFWNKPAHELTYEIMYSSQLIRSSIESKFLHSEISHLTGRCAEFRPQISINGNCKNNSNISFISLHKDWDGPGEQWTDYKRIQVTLFLSDYEKDYYGDEFSFTTNFGEKLNFAKDTDVKAGDLVFWKYSNLHGVESVITEEGQFGFFRITMPNTVFE